MAINTLDGLIAGFKPPQFIWKEASGTLAVGRPYTPFYIGGIPSAAAAPTPGLSGAALTSYAGQIPFVNPSSGQNSYLARFVAMGLNQGGSITLADRLWHNSGITITSTSAQTINSVTFPARDNNGSTNGEGVVLAVEVSSATGAGTPSLTVGYTNSDNTASRTGTGVYTVSSSSPAGTFYPIGLASGDKGVRSIQSLTLGATWTSGTIHLVAYRPIVTVNSSAAGVTNAVDALTSGLPRLYDDSVLFLIFTPSATTSTLISGMVTVAQG